jgi:hypothetical protein
MSEETTAAPAAEQSPKPAPTHEELVAIIRKNQEKDFDRHDRTERLRILIRKSSCGHAGNNPLFGAYNPSLEYTLEELKVLVPLERDRLNYTWVNEKKKTVGVFAANKHGLYAIPHTRGRRKPHMNHKQQAIKSASIRIFRRLLDETSQSLKATCKDEQIEYLGIPDAMIPELGAKAARIAIREVTAQRKAWSKAKRRRQEHSRKVNAGLLGTSTSEINYVSRKGEYGS